MGCLLCARCRSSCGGPAVSQSLSGQGHGSCSWGHGDCGSGETIRVPVETGEHSNSLRNIKQVLNSVSASGGMGAGLRRGPGPGGQECQQLNTEYPHAWPVAILSHPHIRDLGAMLPGLEKLFIERRVQTSWAAGSSQQEGQARGTQGPSPHRWGQCRSLGLGLGLS